jgi:hypothetical protein
LKKLNLALVLVMKALLNYSFDVFAHIELGLLLVHLLSRPVFFLIEILLAGKELIFHLFAHYGF